MKKHLVEKLKTEVAEKLPESRSAILIFTDDQGQVEITVEGTMIDHSFMLKNLDIMLSEILTGRLKNKGPNLELV